MSQTLAVTGQLTAQPDDQLICDDDFVKMSQEKMSRLETLLDQRDQEVSSLGTDMQALVDRLEAAKDAFNERQCPPVFVRPPEPEQPEDGGDGGDGGEEGAAAEGGGTEETEGAAVPS